MNNNLTGRTFKCIGLNTNHIWKEYFMIGFEYPECKLDEFGCNNLAKKYGKYLIIQEPNGFNLYVDADQFELVPKNNPITITVDKFIHRCKLNNFLEELEIDPIIYK